VCSAACCAHKRSEGKCSRYSHVSIIGGWLQLCSAHALESSACLLAPGAELSVVCKAESSCQRLDIKRSGLMAPGGWRRLGQICWCHVSLCRYWALLVAGGGSQHQCTSCAGCWVTEGGADALADAPCQCLSSGARGVLVPGEVHQAGMTRGAGRAG
jgi:hypothetical protein